MSDDLDELLKPPLTMDKPALAPAAEAKGENATCRCGCSQELHEGERAWHDGECTACACDRFRLNAPAPADEKADTNPRSGRTGEAPVSISRVLGIDPGTYCGFALLDEGERIASGTWDLSIGRHESAGMRFVKLEHQLREILENGVDLIAFEEVVRHAGTQAAHIYGGIVAVIKLTAEKKGVPYVGIPVGTVKKRATGKGNADKVAMVNAAKRWFGSAPNDNNEADALWIALVATEQFQDAPVVEAAR